MSAQDVICIGSVLWDVIGRTERHPGVGGDVPGRIRRLPGGVAMNIAMALSRAGLRPVLLTAIGTDPEGNELISRAVSMGMDVTHVLRDPALRTDVYMAVECGDQGLVAAVADAHSLEAAGGRILEPLRQGAFGKPCAGTIALDGNLTAALLAEIAADPAFAHADLRVAPASPGKAGRVRSLAAHPKATLYVNLEEARTLTGTAHVSAAAAARDLTSAGFARAVVSDGPRAAAVADASGLAEAVPPAVTVRRVTGAGDTMMAAHIAAELAGATGVEALEAALEGAAAYISAPETP